MQAHISLSQSANTNQLLAKAGALLHLAKTTNHAFTQHALILSSLWFCQLGQLSFFRELLANTTPENACIATAHLENSINPNLPNPCADIAELTAKMQRAENPIPELQRLLQLHRQYPCLDNSGYIVAHGLLTPLAKAHQQSQTTHIASDSTHQSPRSENFTISEVLKAHFALTNLIEESRETLYEW